MNPLPATSVKGVMRKGARSLVGPRHPLIDEVFGSTGNGSPWSWTDVEFESAPERRVRSRIAIDGGTGTVAKEALLRGEEWFADRGVFYVDSLAFVPEERALAHRQLLAASALAVSSLGRDRNRGLGWVSFIPEDPFAENSLAQFVVAARSEGS